MGVQGTVGLFVLFAAAVGISLLSLSRRLRHRTALWKPKTEVKGKQRSTLRMGFGDIEQGFLDNGNDYRWQHVERISANLRVDFSTCTTRQRRSAYSTGQKRTLQTPRRLASDIVLTVVYGRENERERERERETLRPSNKTNTCRCRRKMCLNHHPRICSLTTHSGCH